MPVILLIAFDFFAYVGIALLLLRFMRFLTWCDSEIRVMTKGRRTLLRTPKRIRRPLRLRTLSA